MRTFSLESDLGLLSAKLTELKDVAPVVIDPISAYLGDVDSHRNAEVRALLAPLSDLASRHGVAIIGVSHLNKATTGEALMRVTGSLAFVAAARAVYLVTQDKENRERRLFVPMKNNIGPDDTGLAFCIEGAEVQSPAGPIQTSKVSWYSDRVTVTADEAIGHTGSPVSSALSEAMDWLTEILTEPKHAREVRAAAASAGINPATLRRAAKAIGVHRKKAGMQGGWVWSIPPKVTKPAEDVQEERLDTFDNLGHLREADELAEWSRHLAALD
jgi:hypothetical protein